MSLPHCEHHEMVYNLLSHPQSQPGPCNLGINLTKLNQGKVDFFGQVEVHPEVTFNLESG